MNSKNEEKILERRRARVKAAKDFKTIFKGAPGKRALEVMREQFPAQVDTDNVNKTFQMMGAHSVIQFIDQMINYEDKIDEDA